ncbi:two-component system, chemotaxis family, response regulator CheB [Carnobacterium alterfunditum]|uniref:Protein-glutamate methylesterase/protein-glutamine glutaminase n=1 Tax=Carnobacterium alterfunditum TaxID=28230 RepID=A0A1N6I5H8_9LACT|nr:chemotaxis response regulator protein-glutamate methylesterase [Carnobacterium alterfunditum]SIO27260.1 two-component system, chemotaxis family, response regulator CheB [Carnobacterium alterfunditum]
MNIKVLVVDDSPFMRKIITETITSIDGLEVIGTARNGRDALKAIPQLQPDVITLDIEMPGLNGLETLEIIKKEHNVPVIMMSSFSGEDNTIAALDLGAMDFIEKPHDIRNQSEVFKNEVADKIKPLFEQKKMDMPVEKSLLQINGLEKRLPKKIKAITIGASTGGPKALFSIIRSLPENLSFPIFIVQHMPKGFTTSFSKRLDKESNATVVEAEEGMAIKGGIVYVAPGGYHMLIENNRIKLNEADKIHGVRPAVDYLFETAAAAYGSNLASFILTGMGQDGASGLAEIKKAGGFTVAQNRETSIVYGMPGNAVQKGVIDEIASLNEISELINWMIRMRS